MAMSFLLEVHPTAVPRDAVAKVLEEQSACELVNIWSVDMSVQACTR